MINKAILLLTNRNIIINASAGIVHEQCTPFSIFKIAIFIITILFKFDTLFNLLFVYAYKDKIKN